MVVSTDISRPVILIIDNLWYPSCYGVWGCQDVNTLVHQAGMRIVHQEVFLAGLVRIVVAEKM